MVPSMNPSDHPPFYQMDAMVFQEMCRDLLELEPGIKTCDIYGTPGQSQNGVDIKALIQQGYGSEVGQCKCYEEFPPYEIRKASEEFLKYLSFWQEKNVRRFILFVASSLDRRQQQDEIDRQVKHFAGLGINYEPWSARTLRNKLRHHPEIVFRYTRSQERVEIICGRTFDSTPLGLDGSSGIIDSLLNSQSHLASGLSKELGKRVEDIRELYYEGKLREAFDQVNELHNDVNWDLLDRPLRARILRLKAGYILEQRSDFRAALKEANSLVEDASRLDPGSDDSGVRALLSYYVEGVEAALEIIDQPTTIHAFNLKVGLLLQAERVSDALNLITNPPPNIITDAETKRLHAMVLLARGDVQKARRLIAQLSEEYPRRESVRFVSAMINYFSCFSPSALPPRIVVWPQPESWQLVKKDDESRAMMQEAEREFAALSSRSERGEGRHRVLETWRLACLAMDMTRQSEAGEFCQSLLEREPTHHRVLAWALAYNLDIDFAASMQALEELIDSFDRIREPENLEQILSLAGLYLKLDEAGKARNLLRRWEDEFNKAGAGYIWRSWRGQMLASSGETKEALVFARQERDPTLRRSLMLSALRVEAVRSGDWRAHIRYLEKSFRKTKDGEYLFELCWIKSQEEDWEYVADRSETLAESLATADAVRLAAVGLWNSRRPKKCLRLLNKYERLFPGGVLPGDLWRVRVDCEIKTGSPQAVADAQELVRRDEAAENILTLINAQVRGADLRGAVVAARPLLQRHEDVQPLDLIRVAKWIRLEDSTLARELMRRALPRLPDDPGHVSAAIQVGFSLGLDKEIGQLLGRAQELTSQGAGLLTLGTLNDALSIRRQQLQHIQDVQGFHERGEVPAHFYVGESGGVLADYLHGIPMLHRERADPLTQLPVFVRHGGRPLDEDLVAGCQSWRLHVDVSAFILAHDLGILEKIEKCFRPLYVSTTLLDDLNAQRDSLGHPQPVRITNYKKILDLLQEEKLHLFPRMNGEGDPPSALDPDQGAHLSDLREKVGMEWLQLLLHAKTEKGFVVDFLPVRSRTLEREPVALPPSVGVCLTNCYAVVASLRDIGVLSGEQYSHALEALGSEGSPIEPLIMPPEGSKLLLRGSIASVLARADLLDPVCRWFDVYVDPSHTLTARQQVAENDRAERLSEWVGVLADHVRGRLRDGTYRPLILTDEQLQTRSKDEEEYNAPFTSLLDLMLYDAQEGDVLWVDDRYTNGFSRRGTTPIIGISEVLAALRSLGELTEQEYYRHLLNLWASNCRYVPLSAEEIDYHLCNAEVSEEGEVKESWELSVLRRHVSACLLDINQLQRPPLPEGSPNPQGEVPFVFGVKHAVEDAIIRGWANETVNLEVAEARANWILDNLYTGAFGIRHLLPNSETRGDAVDLLGLDIAGTLTKAGLGIGGFERLQGADSERRKKFISWFDNRVVFRHLRTDAAVKVAAVRSLMRIFGEAAAGVYGGVEPMQDLAISVRMSQLYLDLPQELTDAMSLPPKVLDWIGVKVIKTAKVGRLHFDVSDYTEAVRRAMAGETATTRVTDEDVEDKYSFKIADPSGDAESEGPAVEIIDKEGKLAARVSDPLLWLLSPDPIKREEVLRRHLFWFDCERVALEREIRELVSVGDPHARAARARKWWGESSEVFYRELGERIAKRREFQWSDLTPPSAAGLLRHFRLPPLPAGDISFDDSIRQAAATLIREEGLRIALDRLSRLPIRIPDAAAEGLAELPAGERNELFKEWSRLWVRP
jgi:hypothetical protein